MFYSNTRSFYKTSVELDDKKIPAMKALKFFPSTREMSLMIVPKPTIKGMKDVIVKIIYCAISNNDLRIIKGENLLQPENPIILGHEISGIVEECGREVIRVRVGDRVVVDPHRGCGNCRYCKSEKINECFCTKGNRLGTCRDGGWAQYIRLLEKDVRKVSDELRLKKATLFEPMTYMVHLWEILTPLKSKKVILLIGVDIYCKLFICLCNYYGYKNFTVVPDEDSKSVEKLLVADSPFQISSLDELTENIAEDPTLVFDVVIDFTDHSYYIEQAISILRSEGILCLFGCPEEEENLRILPTVKKIKIITPMIGPFTFRRTIEILELIEKQYLDFGTLGIEMFDLHDYKMAVNLLKREEAFKIIFRIPRV